MIYDYQIQVLIAFEDCILWIFIVVLKILYKKVKEKESKIDDTFYF